MLSSDDPPFLPVGTEVSAKFKGAFCEARIKKVSRVVKCRILANGVSYSVDEGDVVGILKFGGGVQIYPGSDKAADGVVQNVKDCSTYTVVFDDGDERTLKRSQVCLKGAKHFTEGESLNKTPLSNPEQLLPRLAASGPKRYYEGSNRQTEQSSEGEAAPEMQTQFGRVVCVYEDKEHRKWYPAMIVSPDAQPGVRVRLRKEHFVRSFKDGKYGVVSVKHVSVFDVDTVLKTLHPDRRAIDKAVAFVQSDELPPHWDRQLLLGKLPQPSNSEDSSDDDDEPSEEKDRFVAHLYKFMEERGTPINKAPSLAGKDLNLYRLYNSVRKLGGYNKVCANSAWKEVLTRMRVEGAGANAAQVKSSYNKYLNSFDTFYRKLGHAFTGLGFGSRARHRSDAVVNRGMQKKKPPPTDAKQLADTTKPPRSGVKRGDVVAGRGKRGLVVTSVAKASQVLRKAERQMLRRSVSSSAEQADSAPSCDDDDTPLRDLSTCVRETILDGKEGGEWQTVTDDGGELAVGQVVGVKYGADRRQLYEARIQRIERRGTDQYRYFVHYFGWNARHDSYVARNRITLAAAPAEKTCSVAIADSPRKRCESGRSRHLSAESRSSMASAYNTRLRKDRSPSLCLSPKRRRRKSSGSSDRSVLPMEQVVELTPTIEGAPAFPVLYRRSASPWLSGPGYAAPVGQHATSKRRTYSESATPTTLFPGELMYKSRDFFGITPGSGLRPSASAASIGAMSLSESPIELRLRLSDTDGEEDRLSVKSTKSAKSVLELPSKKSKCTEELEEPSCLGSDPESTVEGSDKSPPYGRPASPSSRAPNKQQVKARKRRRRISHMGGPSPRKNSKSAPKNNNHDCDDNGATTQHSSVTALKHRLMHEMDLDPSRPRKYHFLDIDAELEGDRRIAMLQERLVQLRETYARVKTHLSTLERKRKRALERKSKQKDKSFNDSRQREK